MACYFFKHGRLHVFHGMFFKKKNGEDPFFWCFFPIIFSGCFGCLVGFFCRNSRFWFLEVTKTKEVLPPKKKKRKKNVNP